VARGLPRTAVLLTLATLAACVEIDPSYAESFTTTVASTTDEPGPTSSDSSSSSDASTTPAACDCPPEQLCETDVCTPPAKLLFVNLDGVTTTLGNADASQDVQGLYPELAGTWAGYGADEATRQALLAAIAEQWAAYRVIVTDTRPPAGSAPYLMAVVTTDATPEPVSGAAWVAFPDCGDTIPQDVTFVFASPSDGFGVPTHAIWVTSSFARALGLQFTDANDDITGFGDRFVETCYPRAEMPACTAHHPEFCGGDANQQSSHLELEALLGARE
jgi:hypothetical protein